MRRIASTLVLAGAALQASGARAATAPPLSYVQTFGTAGDPVTRLGWGLVVISVVVFVLVTLALLGGILRRRPRVPEYELAVRRDAGGMGWLYVGVSITIVVLAVCAVWTMLTLRAIAMPGAADQMKLHVTGTQWWWRVQYQASDPSRAFTTANEIHIPVGQPVKVELSSEDVIHSFWVPQLSGKIDMIPGQTNELWLQASQPGTYRGQCGEFCGAQHAHMAMLVVAQQPEDFATWRDRQLQPAAAPAPGSPGENGERLFVSRCGACHTVRGTDAGGILGPDLTHLMERTTVAAGALPNTPGNLAAWISNPQSIKPGTRMPPPSITPAELQQVVAYLQTLR
jgi:cytochrome c oxidase subunit II